MSTVTKLKGSKLHFLKRRESAHTLSNGWKVTMRRLSGVRQAEIQAMSMEVIDTGENKFRVKPRLDMQGRAYAEALAEMIVRIEDGEHVEENGGQPVFTAEDIQELDEGVFAELREIYEGKAEAEGKG